jgi:hypothetical protein
MNTFTKAIIIALIAVSSSASPSSSSSSSSVDAPYEYDSSSISESPSDSEDYEHYNYNGSPSSSSSGDLNLDTTLDFIESSNRCVGNPSPNGIRRSGSDNGNGQNFAFRLSGEDKQCTDNHGNLYSYGKFENIRSFEECAEKCVKDSPLELINDGVFRGFDFDCHYNECNCLFDRGSLDKRSTRNFFDRSNRRERGTGTIDRNGGLDGRGWYCGTLVGFMESELATGRRALRGSN